MARSPRRRDVLVVIGTGAMGVAAVRRLGMDRQVLLADYSPARLDAAVELLRTEGHLVDAVPVDVAEQAAVAKLAAEAGARGPLAAVVHTAGVSPNQASSRDIYRIDLLGTAHVLDEFLAVAQPGTAITCIASMAGYRSPVAPELERELAWTPTSELLELAALDLESADTRTAYHLAKRGAQLRVQAASGPYGARGGRVNSVSPGIIQTPMSLHELAGPVGDSMREIVEGSPAGRIGTADDIAAAVAFLSGPDASFITGADLLVDGGAAPFRRWSN